MYKFYVIFYHIEKFASVHQHISSEFSMNFVVCLQTYSSLHLCICFSEPVSSPQESSAVLRWHGSWMGLNLLAFTKSCLAWSKSLMLVSASPLAAIECLDVLRLSLQNFATVLSCVVILLKFQLTSSKV